CLERFEFLQLGFQVYCHLTPRELCEPVTHVLWDLNSRLFQRTTRAVAPRGRGWERVVAGASAGVCAGAEEAGFTPGRVLSRPSSRNPESGTEPSRRMSATCRTEETRFQTVSDSPLNV